MASKRPLISHSELKEITLPSYVLGIIAGVIVILFAILSLVGYVSGTYSPEIAKFGPAILTFFLFVHFTIGVLMLISCYLIRKEHQTLSGTILLLVVSVIGFVLSAGLMIGPILGTIGGILGLTEHEKLIKHHRY
ncbi:hypothetical protein ACFLZX_03820 [Nanoarchaeota archaeon]